MLAYLLNYLMTYLPRDEEGQGMAEYGLILVLIAVAAIVGLSAMGGQLQSLFNGLVEDLTPTT